MKNTFEFLTSILMLGSFACTRSHAESEEGFTSLFNGKDLDGWYLKIRCDDAEQAKRVFAVSHGMVHVFKDFPAEYELNQTENKTHGMMYTNKKYSRFIFRFEYKWGKGIANNFNQYQYDAGMYYHVVDDNIWPKGIEYQIRFNHLTGKNHTGDFWSVPVTWYAGPDNSYLAPSRGGKAMPAKGGELLCKPGIKFHGLNGEWNQCEVIVMGNEYAIHKLNGEIVNYCTEMKISEGIIGLQSETAEIFYRNIRIKEFTETVPVATFMP